MFCEVLDKRYSPGRRVNSFFINQPMTRNMRREYNNAHNEALQRAQLVMMTRRLASDSSSIN